jgi:hypothetical protein
MQRTRETPETMLCHDACFLIGIGESASGLDGRHWRRRAWRLLFVEISTSGI